MLKFSTLAYDVPPISMTVHVVNCSVGDITVSSGDACQKCTRGTFSLDPRNSTCDQCVPNAECPGGALILPLHGFWHSSHKSLQMHRCDQAAPPIGINRLAMRSANATCHVGYRPESLLFGTTFVYHRYTQARECTIPRYTQARECTIPPAVLCRMLHLVHDAHTR